MKKLSRWLGLTLMLLLAACSSSQPTSTTAPVANPTAEFPIVTVVPKPVVDSCVECHTDKESLIANAKVEEEVPEESKGTG